jgi:hypothetical protein
VSAAYAYKADTANFALAGGTPENAWVRGTPDSVLYTVHRLGIARGEANNMLYGAFRHSHVNLGVACTTGTSGLDPANITVSGGFGNRARAALTFVGGGTLNVARGIGATIAGGAGNMAGDSVSDTCAAISGGYANAAVATFSTVGGGQYDTASGYCATVGGGYRSIASGEHATVCGGFNCHATDDNAAVVGGLSNSATAYCATVGGGYVNQATDASATVAGGYSNEATGEEATVGGGYSNVASGMYAAIPGGCICDADGYASLGAGSQAKANHAGCFVWGDSVSYFMTDSVYSTGANQWRVRARGGAWFFSNQAMTTGAYLAPGSNSWESACDSMTKEDFRPVDRKTLLERVATLRVRDYKMKDQDDGTRHIGPVAQDFHNAFEYGGTETGINLADADGVLLAAVQALYDEMKARDEAQQLRIAQLEAELAQQKR